MQRNADGDQTQNDGPTIEAISTDKRKVSSCQPENTDNTKRQGGSKYNTQQVGHHGFDRTLAGYEFNSFLIVHGETFSLNLPFNKKGIGEMESVIKVGSHKSIPGVATITINRPEKRNALNLETVGELSAALDAVEKDPTARAIVLSGAGSVFSAGADLDALRALRSATKEANERDSRALADLFRRIRTHRLPILARVNGHAIAGGAGLMAACDFVVAAEGARMGFTEVKIGFVPAIIMHIVAERLSGRDLRELLLTGRLVDASEARRLGLVNDVVPVAELDLAIDRILHGIVGETSGQAVAHTKRLLSVIPSLSLDAALDIAVDANVAARETEECQEGVAAFLERRDPSWKNGTS